MKELRYEDFKNCAMLAREVNRMLESKERMRSLMECVTPDYSFAPHSTATLPDDKLAYGADYLIELVADYDERIKAYLEHVRIVKDAIDQVPDMNQQAVLRLYFIDGITWEKVSERMFYSRRWCIELAWRALDALGIDREEFIAIHPSDALL